MGHILNDVPLDVYLQMKPEERILFMLMIQRSQPADEDKTTTFDKHILWTHRQTERDIEEESKQLWEQYSVYLQSKNLAPVEDPMDVSDFGGELEDTGITATGDREDEKLEDGVSTKEHGEQVCKTCSKLGSRLRRLRNLTDKEDLTSTELALLENGIFMLYRVEVPFFEEHTSGGGNTQNQCTLCFVKGVDFIWMCILYPDKKPIVTEIGQSNWMCRNGKCVSFFYRQRELNIYAAKFDKEEDAKEFEYNLMFVAEFAGGCTFVRLYGELAVKQLTIKGFAGETNRLDCGEDGEHPFVQYLKTAQKDHGPFSTKLYKDSFDEPLKLLRKRMSEYILYASKLQFFHCKKIISFKKEIDSYKVMGRVDVDVNTLTRITPFCIQPNNSECRGDECSRQRSYRIFAELHDDLLSLADDNMSFNLLFRVLNTYFQYRDNLVNVAAVVINNLYCDCGKCSGNTKKVKCDVEAELYGPKVGISVVDNMYKYFYESQDKPEFPESFSNMDKALRVGNMSIFDDLDNKYKKELYEAISSSRTFHGVNKKFLFGNRHSKLETSILSREIDNSLPLSDLRGHQESRTVSEKRIFAEDFISQFAVRCVMLLRELSKQIETERLRFDLNEWLTLVDVWKVIGTTFTGTPEVASDCAVEEDVHNAANPPIQSNNCSTIPHDWLQYHCYAHGDFRERILLGSGAYGSASVLKHNIIRRVVLKEYHWKTKKEDIKKEIDMLIRLQNNPHIVQLIAFYYNDKRDYGKIPNGILLEYVERNMDSYIHEVVNDKSGFVYRYSYKIAIEQMKGMASAFAAMHKQGIMHRDIKPDNILLTYLNTIKVCDLGMCGDIDKSTKTNNCIGTGCYNSPEILVGSSKYNEKADVFSLGVTMWEQLHRRYPYWNIETRFMTGVFVIGGGRMDMNDKCPKSLQEIIQRAWHQEPVERPSMEVLEKQLDELLLSLPEETLRELVLGPFAEEIHASEVWGLLP